jgi:hypothetical protein
MMNQTTYLLVCEQDRVYTALNRYRAEGGTFEGEYSLLHNSYSHDAYFLSRFLVMHATHPLMVLPNYHPQYTKVMAHYEHFEEDDIPKYMEEKRQRDSEAIYEQEKQQAVGQLQLLIAKKLIEREWEQVQQQPSHSERDTYVLLGKDWAFGWSVRTIDRVAAMNV